MPEFYFDIETTGLDPSADRIVTIQWQPLSLDGSAVGEMTVLKEWESSEREILQRFGSVLECPPFDFVMVGSNMPFNSMFLGRRAQEYGLEGLGAVEFNRRPCIDLKDVMVMVNGGMFTGYNRCPNLELKTPEIDGVDVPGLYREGRYGEILRYIEVEAQAFCRVYCTMRRELGEIGNRYRGINQAGR